MESSEVLRFLDDINQETEAQTIHDLIELLEHQFSTQNKKQIRSSRIDSKFFLQKLLAWYTSCYQQQSKRDSFQQAEFCSRHDSVIFAFARLLVTIARANYQQIIYSVVTFSLEALQLNLSKESAPCFHFLFSMVGRLIADEQTLNIISFNISKFISYAANALVIAAVQKVNFAITSTTIFIRTALNQYDCGMLQQNYLPLKGTTLCDIAEEGGDRHLNAIIEKLPEVKTNKLFKLSAMQNLQLGDSADTQIQKQFGSLRETIEGELYNYHLVYVSATLLRINHRHAAVDIMTSLIHVCQKTIIRLLRFAILPQSILPFITQYLFAKDAINNFLQQNPNMDAKTKKNDAKFQQLLKSFNNAQNQLPSSKVLIKTRDQAVQLSSQFNYLSRRILAFLNSRQAPVQFGQALGEMVTTINNAVYVGQLAIDSAFDSSYSQEVIRLVQPKMLCSSFNNIDSSEGILSKNDQSYIKLFCLLFCIPSSQDNIALISPFKQFQLFQEDVKIVFTDSNVSVQLILDNLSINSEDNKINLRGFDFVNQLYGSDPNLYATLSNALPHTLEGEEEEIQLQMFMAQFDLSAQSIKKYLTTTCIKNNCLLQNFDNFHYSFMWINLYHISLKDNFQPIQQYARLITNYLQCFGITNYNSTLGVHLLIAGIMNRQNLGLKLTNVVDAFYESAQILFNPLLCGLAFDYRATLLQDGPGSISGNMGQSFGIDYTGLQVGDQNVQSHLCSQFVETDEKVLISMYMKMTKDCQLMKYDTKIVLSGIFQAISLVSQMMDSMYADFANSLKVSDVSMYSTILDLTISSIIKVVMPYFQNLDVSIIENMNDLLLEMVQKLSVKSPLTSCVLIMGLNRSKELMKKVQDQLLGQVVQFSLEEPNNVDYITSFTLCCMQSQCTDQYFVDLLVNKVLYITPSFMPYRILTRFLFRDESFRHKNPALIVSLFDPSDYDMKVKKFIMANSHLNTTDKILFLITKLVSLLFEYDCFTEEQQSNVYYLILEYIFDEQYGLLSYISKYNEVQFDSCFNDLNQDTRMQLLMNLSLVCQNPTEPNAIMRFINYYLLHLSQKFNIKLQVAIGGFLDTLLIGSVTRCRELFYKFLMINSVTFRNEESFCYCFSQLCMSKSIEFIRYMSQNLSLFGDKINCNLLLQTFDLKDYETQIQVCKYMKQKKYYLDSLIVSKILKRNCSSYYDGFVRRNQLLRELYNFDYVSYEGLLPMMLIASKSNLVTPLFLQQKLFNFDNNCCLQSNIYNQAVYSFPNSIHLLTVSIDQSLGISQFNGVINGEKDASYFQNLDDCYLCDIRIIDDPITEAAIDHFQTRKLPKAVRLTSFNDIAQLQIMYGDNVAKFLQKLSVVDAIKYLSLDNQRYQEMQQLLAPRFCSTPIRSAFFKNFADARFWFSPPINDFIPAQLFSCFVQMQYGFESSNIIEPLQLQEVQSKNLVDSHTVTKNLCWADNDNNFSQVSIQFAIQTIVQYLSDNRKSFIYDESNPEDQENIIDQYVTPLLYILENQALNHIQSVKSDLYRFTELIPITSFECKASALKALNQIVEIFGFKNRKGDARFPVLDNIFVPISNACNAVVNLEDIFVELLTYDRNIVRFYYNPKMRKPYLTKQLSKLRQVKTYANIIITNINKYGFACCTERIVNKQFGTVSNPYYQLLIMEQDTKSQLMNRLEYIENKPEILSFIKFALEKKLNIYVVVGKLFGLNQFMDDEIIQLVLETEVDKLVIVLKNFIEFANIIKVSKFQLQLAELSFDIITQEHDIYEQLLKFLVKIGSKVVNESLDFCVTEGSDCMTMLKALIVNDHEFTEEEIRHMFDYIINTQESVVSFSQNFADIQFNDKLISQLKQHLQTIELNTAINLKQLIYIATVTDISQFQELLLNAQIVKIEQIQMEATADEFGDFEDFGQDELVFDAGDFGENLNQNPEGQMELEVESENKAVLAITNQLEEFEQQQVVPQILSTKITIDFELLSDVLPMILPLFQAIPQFAATLASAMISDFNNDYLVMKIQVIQSYICFYPLTQDQLDQFVISGFSMIESLSDDLYESLMRLEYQIITAYGQYVQPVLNRIKENDALKHCMMSQFERPKKTDIGLKMSFL